MDVPELRRWGLLIEVLTELSDVERQVVAQGAFPTVFLPDKLLDRWHTTYRNGQDLETIGVSREMRIILFEFDYQITQLIDIVPGDTEDREGYIRNDSVWRAVCELAEYAIQQVVMQTIPEQPSFSNN